MDWMAGEREGLIDVPGGRVWYREIREGPGVPLLCLHGGPGASSGYLSGLESLAADRGVIRYDQVGGGKSEYVISSELWQIPRFLDELDAVRDDLGLHRVHLYGHSWGSMLAVEYLLAGGNGVMSLTLASPWLSTPRYLDDVQALAAQLPGDAPATIRAMINGEDVSPESVDAAVSAFYREHFCRDEASLAALFESGPPGPAYEAMWGSNEFLSTSPVLAGVDLTERLGDLALPVLLLCGEHDSCTPETARFFQSLIPGSETVVLPGCSHMSILEDRDAHVTTVGAFAARVELVAPAQ